jgi:hypothetical protein
MAAAKVAVFMLAPPGGLVATATADRIDLDRDRRREERSGKMASVSRRRVAEPAA